jgi:hypothetical protein
MLAFEDYANAVSKAAKVRAELQTVIDSANTEIKELSQGNEVLIPTPPLPPCASAICGVAPTPGPSPIP